MSPLIFHINVLRYKNLLFYSVEMRITGSSDKNVPQSSLLRAAQSEHFQHAITFARESLSIQITEVLNIAGQLLIVHLTNYDAHKDS